MICKPIWLTKARRCFIRLALLLVLLGSRWAQAQPSPLPIVWLEITFSLPEPKDSLEAIALEWDGVRRSNNDSDVGIYAGSMDLKNNNLISIYLKSPQKKYDLLKQASLRGQPMRLYIKLVGRPYACYAFTWCPSERFSCIEGYLGVLQPGTRALLCWQRDSVLATHQVSYKSIYQVAGAKLPRWLQEEKANDLRPFLRALPDTYADTTVACAYCANQGRPIVPSAKPVGPHKANTEIWRPRNSF